MKESILPADEIIFRAGRKRGESISVLSITERTTGLGYFTRN